MIPQSFIQELLDRVDIVEIVGRYVQLKKGGANFLGLCPFHNEKSPSFTVSPTKQFFHCFGCGAHGSAIGFMMDHTGLGYVEAVEDLARAAGLTVPQEERLPGRAPSVEQKARAVTLGESMTRAGNYYRRQLREAARAIEYLKGRGLSGEIAARFGLGYAPDDWQNLEAEFGSYTQDAVAQSLIECGLLIESEKTDEAGRSRRYDRFRDRVMFPIRSTRGQVIGFGGRVLGAGEPKYLNSPETPLFSKGNELYGLFEARQAIRDDGFVLVTEGYMDVVALAQHGFANAVATLGTACTPVHVQKLMRQADRVVFAFDGDTAGRKAARRAMEAALAHVDDNKHVSFLFLPAEHDPDSYVRAFGAEAFTREIGNAMPLSRFLLKCITEARDLRQPEERARALFDAKPLLQAMPAGALRLQIVRELGEASGYAPAEVERLCELRKAVASRAAPARVKRQPPTGLDQQVLRLLMRFPQLAARIPVEVRAIVGDPAQPHGELLADLLQQCEINEGPPGFAAFHERLMRSPYAEAYEAQRSVVMQDERGEDEAGAELDSAVVKIVLRSLEVEQVALAARIERGEVSPSELDQYRQNAQHIRELKTGGA